MLHRIEKVPKNHYPVKVLFVRLEYSYPKKMKLKDQDSIYLTKRQKKNSPEFGLNRLTRKNDEDGLGTIPELDNGKSNFKFLMIE